MTYSYIRQYVTRSPTISWDTMLNMSKVELKPIPDPQRYILFEKGPINLLSCISNRYRKASKCI